MGTVDIDIVTRGAKATKSRLQGDVVAENIDIGPAL